LLQTIPIIFAMDQVLMTWIQPQNNCSSRNNDFGKDLGNPGKGLYFPGYFL
jgi:hypothetical protein